MLAVRGRTALWGDGDRWRFLDLFRNYQMVGQDLKGVTSREWISGERGAPGALGPRRNSSLGSRGRFVDRLNKCQMEWRDLKDVISREWLAGERGSPGALGPSRSRWSGVISRA